MCKNARPHHKLLSVIQLYLLLRGFCLYNFLTHQFIFLLCVEGLKSLCFLSLDQTKVTDSGMVLYLQSAPSCLSQLSLNQTAVTEATLTVLPACVPQLRLLSIKQTKVLYDYSPCHHFCYCIVLVIGHLSLVSRLRMCRLWQSCPACRLSTWMGQLSQRSHWSTSPASLHSLPSVWQESLLLMATTPCRSSQVCNLEETFQY